jgi:GAF domain-containing protein
MPDNPSRASLELVISNHELRNRPARARDAAKENRSLLSLAQKLKSSRKSILQDLVELALDLCSAHSSGISILEEEDGQQVFRWHGVAGEWSQYVGGTMPRNISPCGTVLDRNIPLLLSHPERHFPFPPQVTPPIVEVLLIPFHVGSRPIGTLWAIAHDESRRFDLEDERLLSSLGNYAAKAYQLLLPLGGGKVPFPQK